MNTTVKPWVCFIKRNGQFLTFSTFRTRKDARQFAKVSKSAGNISVKFETVVTRMLSPLARRLVTLVTHAKAAVLKEASHTVFASKIGKALSVAKSAVVGSIRKEHAEDQPISPLPLFLQKRAA
jgi:predicted transcriptional regulator